MIQTFFKKLAEKEGGTFSYEDAKTQALDGVSRPYVTFRLQFQYKQHHFTIVNTTGTQFVAHMLCKLDKSIRPVDFELSAISHFKNLFLRRKQRLKVSSQNKNLLYFLEQNAALQALRSFGKKESFSPHMVCSSQAYTIETKYHLEFDDWTGVLEPLIQLHKDLIDEFEKGELHVSLQAYKRLKEKG